MAKRRSLLNMAFDASRSWQKGAKYARDAHLVEARTKTEHARRLQIEADTRMKNARTAAFLAIAENGGLPFLGCDQCGVYHPTDTTLTHCEQCGEALTHTTINLKG